MKIDVKIIKTVLCICAAFGWWGVLYPELTMTPDTYRIVMEEKLSMEEETSIEKETSPEKASIASMEDSTVGELEEWDFNRNVYFEILQAPTGQVRFKSRLLMSLKEIF